MFGGIFGIIIAIVALIGVGALSSVPFSKLTGPHTPEATVHTAKQSSLEIISPSSTAEPSSQITHTELPRVQIPRVAETPQEIVPKKATQKEALISKSVTADLSATHTPIRTNVVPTIVATTTEKVVAPGPLRVVAATTSPTVFTAPGSLTVRGVIEYTNGARSQNGALSALVENDLLDRDAQMKLNDMFAKQYFEHVSPTGVGPAELAKAVGYSYVVVGENLALGDFGSDSGVVTAWMNSPGHRRNILNPHYQEIGVAVGKGMYEGRETWLAVQSFGMPTSACPSLDATMKTQIESNNIQITALRAQLDAKIVQINSTLPSDTNYNTLIGEYNMLVPLYNSFIDANKPLIATYNAQVQAYNDCVNSAGMH